jgi:hypothetical protein
VSFVTLRLSGVMAVEYVEQQEGSKRAAICRNHGAHYVSR